MSSSTSADGPLLAVVAVNWNRWERTVECLRSLGAERARLLLVVVDSASEEDRTRWLEAQVPGVQVLRLEANRGYAAGCNAGARLALAEGASHLLLLNNDTLAEPGALDALLAASLADPRAALGPLIVHADRPDTVWAAGGVVTHPWLKTRHLGEGEPAGNRGSTAEPDAEPNSKPDCKPDWLTGCALFMPAAVFEHVGPLDEEFFLYLEDTDWCLRARRLGHPCRLVPGAVIRHDVSASVAGPGSAQVRYYAYRNHYRFALRHAAAWERPLIAADLVWTLLKIGLRWSIFPSYRRDAWYHARTRGLLDLLRGRGGEGMAAA